MNQPRSDRCFTGMAEIISPALARMIDAIVNVIMRYNLAAKSRRLFQQISAHHVGQAQVVIQRTDVRCV